MDQFCQERSSVLCLLQSQKPMETCGHEKQVHVWLYLNTLRDRPTGILDSTYSITSTFPKTVVNLAFLSFLLKHPRSPISIPTIIAVVLVFIWTMALGFPPIFPPVQLESFQHLLQSWPLSWHSPCTIVAAVVISKILYQPTSCLCTCADIVLSHWSMITALLDSFVLLPFSKSIPDTASSNSSCYTVQNSFCAIPVYFQKAISLHLLC